MQSLAVKWRPRTFDEMCGQSAVIKILEQQLETSKISNCYLFAGGSGCGKTTLARALGFRINKGQGQPTEIDAASHNGVDDVREIVAEANQRSLDSEYKIFIIDECHALSSAAWQAFLKCIEEPPKYTIFMFCTTNPEKIPATILNRVMRLNITKIPTNLIVSRLKYICQQEGFTNYNESCDFIAKLAQGGMRDAISMLEKCANYDPNLDINNVLACLGNYSYDSFFNLTNAIIDRDQQKVLTLIDEFFNTGNDLKIFVEQYLDFVLDLNRFALFKTMSVVKIPESMLNQVKYVTEIGADDQAAVAFYNKLTKKILDIKNAIKYDVNSFSTIEVMFIQICRGE